MTAAEAVCALGLVDARDVSIARAIVAECPFVDLEHYEIDLRNAALLPRSAAERARAFPIFVSGRFVVVGMVDPLDLAALDRVRQVLGLDVEPVLCEPGALDQLIERAYSLGGEASRAAVDETSTAPSALVDESEPIVAAVNQIVLRAVAEGASDIHLGPDERELHLRYRIDGVLHPRRGPPLSSHPGLVQRLKVLAQLDLTVTRKPQDGKFRMMAGGKPVDVRASFVPTVCGENVVLRLFTGAALVGPLADLGMDEGTRATLEAALDRPHGMILVTGPTGSGKTTTLYSCIKRLNTPDVNIVTIEDPVEIRMPMVRQVQVSPEQGLGFAAALRAILRQDPDVILLGEIRDEETARIAVQAALTGHLVLATLHTNDAAGAIARLRDLGTPGFAINAAVLCAVAQRLVRRVCEQCARPSTPPAALLRRFGATSSEASFRKGTGCPSCLGLGLRGRVGIYEVLELASAVQALIEAGASTNSIREEAERAGMTPMWRDGLYKACRGVTTLEEVAAVAAPQGPEGKGRELVRLSA
ncbi:GspE/PulE family protein [Leptolyngbya sp. 15MV]|nr:GspE/PulE family protein [Leptolyngbya sp. 15MV]